MKPPDPEKERAAPGKESGHNSGESTVKVTTHLLPVKRFCRPISASELAERIAKQLMARVETGSDFDERVRRTKADALRKGKK